MRIGFRVDSSKALGIGHINRSLVLASEFKKSGAKVFFFTSNLNGNQDRLIKDNGFNLIKLNKEEVLQKNYNKNYLNKDA